MCEGKRRQLDAKAFSGSREETAVRKLQAMKEFRQMSVEADTHLKAMSRLENALRAMGLDSDKDREINLVIETKRKPRVAPPDPED